MSFLARSITLSVRRPRKSILSSPTFSHVGPSHCVTTSFSPAPLCLYSGTISCSGRVATITPAACTELCRAWPSIVRALSITCLIFASVSYHFFRSGSSISA